MPYRQINPNSNQGLKASPLEQVAEGLPTLGESIEAGSKIIGDSFVAAAEMKRKGSISANTKIKQNTE